MRENFENWVSSTFKNINSDMAISIIIDIIYLLGIVLICFVAYVIIKKIVLNIIKRVISKTENKWDDAIFESKSIHRFLNLIPGIVVYSLAYLLTVTQKFVELFAIIYISFMTLAAIFAFLEAINLIYDKNYTGSKQRPIKGFVTLIKIVLFVVAIIIVVAKLMGQSPVYILSGLGALSAITMLIFKDSILGMVAGVQMASNDLVRIGDWIEMPKYGADGDVIDISLTVVKVMNFDKTITTIPAYALVSDSFKNWRGMQAAGGRRIKRAINIDISSISFCSEQLLKDLSKIGYLKEYLNERTTEIEEYNELHNVDTSTPVNGRRLTNIGTFRRYITEYLKKHPKIHKDMIVMVRQLAPASDGIPIEIYAFTNDIVWENYEGIMADIFDHLLAVAPYFNLRVFQTPTGNDIKSIKGHN